MRVQYVGRRSIAIILGLMHVKGFLQRDVWKSNCIVDRNRRVRLFRCMFLLFKLVFVQLAIDHLNMILLELLNRNVLNNRLWRLVVKILVIAFHLLISLHKALLKIDNSVLKHHFLCVSVHIKHHLLSFW